MKKCLVIDDVEVTRYIVEQIMVSLGLENLSATTPEEALSLLQKNNVDIVLLDWHLRKESGIDVLAKIKNTCGASTKVIVFSGVEGVNREIEVRQAGGDAFLEKPTTKTKLESCLKKLGVI